jgi:hypothetical protein
MTYDFKPLAFDPKSIKGLSEKLLVSHYENNYGGAVKRLNAIRRSLPRPRLGISLNVDPDQSRETQDRL